MAPPEPLAARCVAVTRRFTTPSGVVTAVDAVDLDVAHGAFTVVSGPSGSGKSTLLGLVACLDRPDAGTVEVGGVEVGSLSRRRRRQVRRELLGVVLPQPIPCTLDLIPCWKNWAI